MPIFRVTQEGGGSVDVNADTQASAERHAIIVSTRDGQPAPPVTGVEVVDKLAERIRLGQSLIEDAPAPR